MAPATTTSKTKSRRATKKSRKHHRKGTQRESIAAENREKDDSSPEEPSSDDDAEESLPDGPAAGSSSSATVTTGTVTTTTGENFDPLVNTEPECRNTPGNQSTMKMAYDSEHYVLTKLQKNFDETCEHWCENIIRSIGKKIFNGIQFITRAEHEAFGSPFQYLVCKEAGVDPVVAERFWNRKKFGGLVTARAALNRRRMNTTNAMKKKFLGEYHIPQMQGLLAGCSMMLINCLIWC